ncbi:MarR family winged helix-turn-helix transcriptional regulator [Neotabrizicola shimadae]|uniref:Winged helix-turn-helix transcriptional regulator n=1 Tax=Neotabrizicola shimadae TaxID=2807096 RepID=A0A8G0ZTY1_9RHOB|nr:MarR family winged helix-turn-helix transcriptional regulator [Neotabrizicola shimadae]QYZ70384.1 winged helix-turn-helix transcriptional regulator [Neotabrizicola shimadae]
MTTAPHDSYVERLTAALAGAGFAPPVAEALAGFDQENYQFIRRVRKGDIPKALIEGLGVEVEPMQFHALAAVTRIASGFGRDGPGEVTVGHLAEDLMVDASRASRLASDLVDRGFLRRAVSQQDGRRSVLEATEAGQALIERFLAAKWERTIRLFRDWPEEDILTFARLFRRYGEGMREQYPSG